MIKWYRPWVKALSLAVMLGLPGLPGIAAELNDASESRGLNLTVYNQNFGLVKDVRDIKLADGMNFVRFADVAARIDPTSVSFQSLTAPNAVVVREQNYQYDLLNPQTILSKSVGKQVTFRQTLPGGQIKELTGTLLNPPEVNVSDSNGGSSFHTQGLVIKTADGVVLNPQGQAELSELPAGLVAKPSLLWKLVASKAGEQRCEIAYQTSGLNWHCDYVAIVNDDDSKTNLTSWVTLDNKSGAAYKNAQLKLIAGDVHRVMNELPAPRNYRLALAAAPQMDSQFAEQSFAEYHLYSLKDKTDLNDNETKQLSLFNAGDVPVHKAFVFEAQSVYGDFRPSENQKVKVKLELQNTKANGLGIPMPKGKVRVYKRDSDGALQFIGEDLIDHTPQDEKVKLEIGDAFDLVGERKQTSSQQVSNKIQRLAYEISLRNHKDTDVTITDVEHATGAWKIIDSSLPYVKKDSQTFEFPVKVKAHEEVKLTYTIELAPRLFTTF